MFDRSDRTMTSMSRERRRRLRLFALISALALLSTVSDAFFIEQPETLPEDPSDIEPFIKGGARIDIARHPYLLSLRDPGTSEHKCAAFLISPAVAVTAAHCLDYNEDLVPHLAKSCPPGDRLCQLTGGQHFERVEVDFTVKHPRWTGNAKEGADLAMIVLKAPLEGHPTLAVLPQPEPSAWEDNKTLFAMGWGIVSDDEQPSDALQGVVVFYHSVEVCHQKYIDANYGRVITPEMICAGQDGKGTCQGDSGGPLIIMGRSWEEDLAVGIVAFGGEKCGTEDDVPGVFTRLKSFTKDLEYALSISSRSPPAVPSEPSPTKAPVREGTIKHEGGICSLSGRCTPDLLESQASREPFCEQSEDHCRFSCGGTYCSYEDLVGSKPEGPPARPARRMEYQELLKSVPLPGGPRAAHTFTSLSDCPRVFVSVTAELVDMSFLDKDENLRVRLSGGAGGGRQPAAWWSECRHNSLVHGNTCGKWAFVVCSEDASELTSGTGDLTVEVLGSKFITEPCDDGVALSAVVTVECAPASAMVCSGDDGIGALLGTTKSKHCRDEASRWPSPPPPLPPSPPPPSPSPPPPPPPPSPSLPPPPSPPPPSPFPPPPPSPPPPSPFPPPPPSPPPPSPFPPPLPSPPPPSPSLSPGIGEGQALMALKEASAANRQMLSGWNWSKPKCEWAYVTCSASGRVTELFLDSKGLKGTIPPQLSVLGSLTKMKLDHNSLTGTLPPQWSALGSMSEMDLDQNSLTGTLPPQWSAMGSLTKMALWSNSLTGTLPPQWSALESLSGMYLRTNSLTGTLPPQWSALESLTRMALHENSLTGTLPPQWSALKSLTRMYLYENSLTGTLPPQWSVLGSLTRIYLESNPGLSGSRLPGWPSGVNFRI